MKRDDAGYMAVYMKQYRQTQTVKGERCACGERAHRKKCSEWVCARCDELEALWAQLELRSGELRSEGCRKGQGGWLTRERVTPKLSLAERYWAESRSGAARLVVQVVECANEIVVRAHGEYHLTVRKNAAG